MEWDIYTSRPSPHFRAGSDLTFQCNVSFQPFSVLTASRQFAMIKDLLMSQCSVSCLAILLMLDPFLGPLSVRDPAW